LPPPPSVNRLTATRHTPRWRLPFGECTFPNGNSPYPPQWGVPTGHCPLPNGESLQGSVQSQMWTPRWGLGSVHSRMESPYRGVYTPPWDSPLGNVHSPVGTPRWGVYPPHRGLPTGDCTLFNGESPRGSIHSVIETPHWGVYSPQWGLPSISTYACTYIYI
jgi:hypothetical protein